MPGPFQSAGKATGGEMTDSDTTQHAKAALEQLSGSQQPTYCSDLRHPYQLGGSASASADRCLQEVQNSRLRSQSSELGLEVCHGLRPCRRAGLCFGAL